MEIAKKLKELRVERNLEIEEVLVKLQEAGYEVSEDKMLQYEEDAKKLDADTFLELCKIYEVDDIMAVFNGKNMQ